MQDIEANLTSAPPGFMAFMSEGETFVSLDNGVTWRQAPNELEDDQENGRFKPVQSLSCAAGRVLPDPLFRPPETRRKPSLFLATLARLGKMTWRK